LHVPEFNPTSFISKKQILLDGISDPGNMGTILRTADWFGFDEIICSEDTVELYNPKVVQSTMGSLFRVKVIYTDLPKYIESIAEKGFAIAGADLDGVNAFEYQFPEKTALVIGSESHGIRPNVESLLTQKVHIPGSGNAESLNAGIAAGILLSCWFKIKS
jgi:TrmH family RNA methyltransferase